ncbi:MAG: tRNA guanosine(34) transglycosylase Tgt [Spirochaetes bacterium]|nr:MAG: tRNA guanosine(34) transglycosylase Tgt [Spirochaetota bacterium]
MFFSVLKEDTTTRARTGVLFLKNGNVLTPAFMPVGTYGTVKAISGDALLQMEINLVLSNTYHLYLRPGLDTLEKFGGLRSFTGWKGNILTDSGGYQIFSLSSLRKIEKEGVVFRSHIDGSLHTLSPEDVVKAQKIIGSDILMTLDVCTPPGISYREAAEALEITSLWAKRSKYCWLSLQEDFKGQLFGIVQGNFFKDLRKRSVEEILELDFPGIAIGGLSVGEEQEVFYDYLNYTSSLLPGNKPRYLMGVGTPEYILSAVENGIDLFDCVFPTRVARNGTVFTSTGLLPLKREYNKHDMEPIDKECNCRTCRNHSRAFLRHLFKTKEIMGPVLATEHNIFFIQNLIKNIRKNINLGNFRQFKEHFLQEYLGDK